MNSGLWHSLKSWCFKGGEQWGRWPFEDMENEAGIIFASSNKWKTWLKQWKWTAWKYRSSFLTNLQYIPVFYFVERLNRFCGQPLSDLLRFLFWYSYRGCSAISTLSMSVCQLVTSERATLEAFAASFSRDLHASPVSWAQARGKL